ncbi:MAG: type II toxin-antitoxin system HipA family toxin [Alphaproteobacteria bacterium]|nr:type II toxin-antitoxin system HipA family toxin [Alphaproteobacteria bacterium]
MDAAIVSVHEVRVGRLDRLSDDEDFVFTFDPAWLADPDRPTLGQLFVDRMPKRIETSGLPCWFDHLLPPPRGPARRLLQRWAGLDEEEDDLFALLVAMGADLPGAVTLEPAELRLFGPGSYARRIRREPAAPEYALPGAQSKISARDGQGGLVVAARGEKGHYIAKFDDPRYPELPRLEWATTEWASRAGVNVHDADLVSTAAFGALPEGLHVGDGQVFLATRFDRSPEGSVHAEDLGQLLDIPAARLYHASYEAIGEALRWLCPDDVQEYVERLGFMLVCGNGDAHLKNWGVIYPDRRTPRLGPAYDLVATVARAPRDTLALSLDGSKAFESVSRSSFRSLARALEADEAQVVHWIRAACARAQEVWRSGAGDLPLTADERERIDDHIRRVPLLAE